MIFKPVTLALTISLSAQSVLATAEAKPKAGDYENCKIVTAAHAPPPRPSCYSGISSITATFPQVISGESRITSGKLLKDSNEAPCTIVVYPSVTFPSVTTVLPPCKADVKDKRQVTIVPAASAIVTNSTLSTTESGTQIGSSSDESVIFSSGTPITVITADPEETLVTSVVESSSASEEETETETEIVSSPIASSVETTFVSSITTIPDATKSTVISSTPTTISTVSKPTTRKTITVVPTRPVPKPTCITGWQNPVRVLPRVTVTRSTVTGNDGVVTFYRGVIFKQKVTVLPRCMTTITIKPPNRPPFKTKCAKASMPTVIVAPPVTFKETTRTGYNNVVTVRKGTVYPSITRTLRPCTVTVPPPTRPPFQYTCASGKINTVVVARAQTFKPRTFYGRDQFVTVREGTTYPAITRTLPLCSTTIDPPPRPPFSLRCAPESLNGTVTVEPAVTIPASSITGFNRVVTIRPGVTYPEVTRTLSKCTTTLPAPSRPPFQVTCAPSGKGTVVVAPAVTFHPKTVTGKDRLVTVQAGTTYEKLTRTIPVCPKPTGPACSTSKPVCLDYKIWRAWYQGKWVIYKTCTRYGFIDCKNPDFKYPDHSKYARTTILKNLKPAAAKALVAEGESNSIVNNALKRVQQRLGRGIQIVDENTIDWNKVKSTDDIQEVEILKVKPALGQRKQKRSAEAEAEVEVTLEKKENAPPANGSNKINVSIGALTVLFSLVSFAMLI